MSTKKGKTVPGEALVKPDEASPRERAALQSHDARRKGQKPAPRLMVSEKNGVPLIDFDHPDNDIGATLLMEALGTAEPDFLGGLLKQLATQGRAVDEDGLNFMLAMVTGMKPKDQVEAMLAAQMAAVHNATMTFARRLNHVEGTSKNCPYHGEL